MNWKNIKLIFLREVRDQLRDRRTLFMVAVLPLLLYPAIGIGTTQMALTLSDQVRNVVVIGADEIPSPELIRDHRFVSIYFHQSSDADKLRVITDAADSLENDELNHKQRAEFQAFLKIIKTERPTLDRLARVQQLLDNGVEPEAVKLKLELEEVDLRGKVTGWFATAPAQVLVIFPAGFREQYAQMNENLALGKSSQHELDNLLSPIILHDSANDKSNKAFQRVRQALREWEKLLLEKRLEQASLPRSLPNPVQLTNVDLAEADGLAANFWSKFFPALLTIMLVTGAFYPAIDLGAGEKERGTMETLLISPATRTEIVLGKFFTVMVFSLTTALLNLCSMGLTGLHVFSGMAASGGASVGDLTFPPLLSLIWVFALAVPLAALFSALSLAFAMFAKSSKEGQYYLTPLLMVTMGLTMFCLNPAVELKPYHSMLPVVGPALLLKSLLLGGASASAAWAYVVPVLVTSFAYSALALWWAIEQFQSEGILFREAERFELGLWFKHLLRDKEAIPSFTEAGVCFVLIALLQFVFLTSMQKNPTLMNDPSSMVVVQLIYLIATVGFPPVMMAMLLTAKPLKSLKLRLPGWKMIAAAIILPLTLQPLALTLMTWLDPYFPPMPAGGEELMKAMATDAVPLWLSFATFAIAPAVCEEFAFRGFILSGLQRSRHKWLPIVISAVLFGVIHMIPKQQFNAALLGLVLGLLAVRSRSLIPCMIFHMIFNGTQVLATRLDVDSLKNGVARYAVQITETPGQEPTLAYTFGCLGVCLLVSIALINWLWKYDQPTEETQIHSSASNALATEA